MPGVSRSRPSCWPPSNPAQTGMRITPLASGSQGNSVLIESPEVRVLIDVGIAHKDIEERLRLAGVAPRSIDAVLVTHRHRDHARGVTDFCRANRARVYATRRTARSVGSQVHKLVRRIEPGRPFTIGDLGVIAVPVSHDAPDTVAVLIERGPLRYGHATDLGCADGPIGDYLTHCTGLFLEFNHDLAMLRAGPYAPHLKHRIAGDRGHLSNDQAAELLTRLRHDRLRHLWLAHLSRANNRPELARAAALRALGPGSVVTVHVALQDAPSPMVELARSS